MSEKTRVNQKMYSRKQEACNALKKVEEQFENIKKFFALDFESDNEEEKNDIGGNENIEITDEVIHTIMQIKEGETKIYKYKNIHLSAYMNCEGELIFDHCIINYNESDYGNGIALSENAKLTITNSVVICKGLDENTFITCKGKNKIILDRNSFEDCSYFINTDGECEFFMTNCQLHNCYKDFININSNAYYGKKYNSRYIIKNNSIIQDGLKPFYYAVKESFSKPSIINGNYGDVKVEFCNNSILEEEGFRRAGVEGENAVEYFNCYSGEVRNCTFKGISSPINAVECVECKFEKCIGAIRVSNNMSPSRTPYVDNCVFEECTSVIGADYNTHITNCQFISCYDSIIFPAGFAVEFAGGVTVESCQFINTRNRKFMESTCGGFSCVTFTRTKNSDGRANYLRKCIFDGAELGNNFLIKAWTFGFEKPYGVVTYIENCDFRNCSTKRASGKIIKEYIQYDRLFKKDIDFHANRVSGCRGLDKVNKEGIRTEAVEIRSVSTMGNIIGSTLELEDNNEIDIGNQLG